MPAVDEGRQRLDGLPDGHVDQPVAVIVRPDVIGSRSRVQDLFDQADRLNRLIEDAGKRPLSPGGLSAEYAEELIADIRAGREAHGRL